MVSIDALFKAIRKFRVEKILLSYVFYRRQWRKRLEIPFLEKSLKLLSEKQSIASSTGFSLPLSEKNIRLKKIGKIANQYGFSRIITCGCKNKVNLAEIGFDSAICEFHWR